MGYKVFGVKVNPDTVGDLGYTVSGSVQAYAQHTQDTPPEMHRLGHWPAEMFDAIAPPIPERPQPLMAARRPLEDHPAATAGGRLGRVVLEVRFKFR